MYLYKTDAVSQVVGAGSAFKSGGDMGSTTISNIGYLTRNQQQKFEGRLRSEVLARYNIQDPADVAILDNYMKVYFTDMLKPQELPLDGTFAGQLAKLSKYEFDPRDMKPQDLTNIANDVKKQFADESSSKINVGANASFLGFGGGGSFDKEDARKIMTQNGWKFGAQGNVSVPKSLSVYVFDKTTLEKEGVVNLSIRRSNMSGIPLEVNVTTRKGVYPDPLKETDRWKRLIQDEKDVKELKALVTALEQREIKVLVKYGVSVSLVKRAQPGDLVVPPAPGFLLTDSSNWTGRKEYGKQVLAAWLEPFDNLGDNHFEKMDAEVYPGPDGNKVQLRLAALGNKPGRIQFKLIIVYRNGT